MTSKVCPQYFHGSLQSLYCLPYAYRCSVYVLPECPPSCVSLRSQCAVCSLCTHSAFCVQCVYSQCAVCSMCVRTDTVRFAFRVCANSEHFAQCVYADLAICSVFLRRVRCAFGYVHAECAVWYGVYTQSALRVWCMYVERSVFGACAQSAFCVPCMFAERSVCSVYVRRVRCVHAECVVCSVNVRRVSSIRCVQPELRGRYILSVRTHNGFFVICVRNICCAQYVGCVHCAPGCSVEHLKSHAVWMAPEGPARRFTRRCAHNVLNTHHR